MSSAGAPSFNRQSRAVNARSIGSPAGIPYCNDGRPFLRDFNTSSTSSRVSVTGSVSLSVNPAASEIICGRDSATSINHEIAGGSERRPSRDNATCFMYNLIY